MKKNYLKKLLALMIALSMLLSFAACDSSTGRKGSSDEDEESYDEAHSEDVIVVTDETELEAEGMKYVLIYNPEIYDETQRTDKTAKETGYFGSQIVVDGDRGDELEEETNQYIPVSPSDLMQDFDWSIVNLEGDRGDTMGIDYDEGDVKEFYTHSYNMTKREAKEFECVYSGEYCHIWVADSRYSSYADDYGEMFDEEIFEQVTESFGYPRFTSDDGGKVNILFYDLMEGLCGFFYQGDAFSSSEVSDSEAKRYGYNTNHDIININTWILSDELCTNSTMAHEFQHLITFTNYFSTVNGVWCDTWMNEGMSGYIEEQLFPGTKENSGHFKSFNSSDLIRNGQSLYNFTTTDYDIGVYGSVYYFAEYLAEQSGADVFSNFHEYWRESYSDTLCVSEALVNSVSSSFYKKVNNPIEYDGYVDFDSDEDEWMSKMTLNFYLHMLQEKDDFEPYDSIKVKRLLYDDLDGTDIEGGGRIIVAVSDECFEIPEDADSGLIYVGLDEDFNVVTPFIYK